MFKKFVMYIVRSCCSVVRLGIFGVKVDCFFFIISLDVLESFTVICGRGILCKMLGKCIGYFFGVSYFSIVIGEMLERNVYIFARDLLDHVPYSFCFCVGVDLGYKFSPC